MGAALLLLGVLCAGASAAPSVKTVTYHGYRLTVPHSWPVFNLRRGSTTCVRFNRHAVYLGVPSAAQHCPAHAAGHTEAILVEPQAASFTTSAAAAPAAARPAQPAGGSETQIAKPGVEVTATWRHAPAIIKRALGVGRLTPGAASITKAPRATFRTDAASNAVAHAASTGTIYTGRGFDACSTPSTTQMSAWGSSPYRALGVYIGGTNSACAQPNLNTSWMANEWAAGWHVIPIYVGLQAPSNSCGCAAMSSSQAASQGTAAATDAVAHAQAVGIGPGNPIYNDMEGYSRTSTNSTAVLNFLAAWTAQLHADGYGSGVYSSGGSGVADLASRNGTGYTEPDDIWVADWNGQATTSDSYIPSGDWTDHQRLHQYAGAHNETYGGVTINIDSDYVDAATAAGGATAAPAATPSLQVTPTASGPVNLKASWVGVGGISGWRTLGGSNPSVMNTLNTTASGKISQRSVFPYYAVQALNSSGQVLGTSTTIPTRPHVALYGRSAYVPGSGAIGVPGGCFTGSRCQITLTVHAGRQLIASTQPEALNSSSGLLFFKLSAAGRRTMNRARGGHLAVTVTAHDVSGRSAKMAMTLIRYTTTGAGPRRSSTHSGEVNFVGLRDFVYRSSTGGILASCVGKAPCLVVTKITAGRRTVATTGTELVGANSAAYLSYRLTGYGRTLVAQARGNQLGALVTLRGATGTASGHISLSGFR